MKVVIIGSGIAGITLTILLKQKGFTVSIYEKGNQLPAIGHAFLVHPDAKKVIELIAALNPAIKFPGHIIQSIILKRPDNSTIQTTMLDAWQCLKRKSIIQYLSAFLSEEDVHYNKIFSHFVYEGDKAVAAVFEDGDIVYGDVFIGADGSFSQVRKLLFGEVLFSPVEVKEIVGLIHHPLLVTKFSHVFTKYISEEKGLAFGLIPCSDEELVWFMQFDVLLQNNNLATADELKSFCTSMLANFPEAVQEVLANNNFENNYVWRSTDLDLLPSFHKGNVALVGDAAHLALPFTSAGTTNALYDAKVLSELLVKEVSLNNIFTQFYQLRSQQIKEHIGLGRAIKYNFLNTNQTEIKLPLILDL